MASINYIGDGCLSTLDFCLMNFVYDIIQGLYLNISLYYFYQFLSVCFLKNAMIIKVKNVDFEFPCSNDH